MAGGVAWQTDDPRVDLPRPLRPLPSGAALQLSVARTLRFAREPLAEHPVVPDVIRRLPAAEVGDDDAGLLAHASRMLANSRAASRS